MAALNERLLHERVMNTQQMKQVQQYTQTVSDTWKLCDNYLQADCAQLAEKDVLQFEADVKDLKFKLIKNYYLIKQYLMSLNLIYKSFSNKIDELMLNYKNLNQLNDLIVNEKKTYLMNNYNLLKFENAKLTEIDKFININLNYSSGPGASLANDNNDNDLIALSEKDLAEFTNNDPMLLNRARLLSRKRASDGYRYRLKFDYSLEYLRKYNELLNDDLSFFRENISTNKKNWVLLSSKIKTLIDSIDSIDLAQ
ncbi:uncharacterized protein ASCRUDRAFT_78561 [Ascoidea rubescens DSM 1968]|uniref:Uncharacterized protein n=1 Tax=Ascoidea rubescens DSM 1968 TaxID=1344418 RepID=A0A1D2VPE0_9ASCO|nr:hypothetical protein ASCRUDRAFT_78561 [Ascoidea rubescens DSM 1968]ODV63466.1 hypothetical protein ASCRUDRAFT_78561 [Ascoidea rubescens DSM 1968]